MYVCVYSLILKTVAATIEISIENSQKAKNKFTI